ncbi:hypothetical protein PA08_2193 [Cutibacterium modestum P08]|nr:hypothetical protein PA08_2193 [Cutibacterium modestum P08]
MLLVVEIVRITVGVVRACHDLKLFEQQPSRRAQSRLIHRL